MAKVTQNQLQRSLRWYEAAYPDPTTRDTHEQIGSHLRHITEMLAAYCDAGSSQKMREQLSFAVDVLLFIERQISAHTQGSEIVLTDINRVDLMESLCNQVNAIVGITHMLRLDIDGGLGELSDSNDTRFDLDHSPIFDTRGRIVNGADYAAPDFAKFA